MQSYIRSATVTTSLGWIIVAATPKGVCMIEFGDTPEALQARLASCFPHAHHAPADAEFNAWLQTVVTQIEAPHSQLSVPLDIQGTAFQQRVWKALQSIPAGTTTSYAEIAQGIEQPRAVRAVAQACAANPVAVAIPCHRVISSDGSLGGYRGGVERKQSLLAREAGSVSTSRLDEAALNAENAACR